MLKPDVRREGTRENPELSLFEFRGWIFHYGIERALEDALNKKGTVQNLARDFLLSHPWTDDPREEPQIQKLFEGSIHALQELALLLRQVPSLPEAKPGAFSVGLTVFPVAESEWEQVEWPRTSDVIAFSKAANALSQRLNDADLVLPQGGFYIPAHVRIGVPRVLCAQIEGSPEYAELSHELFLPVCPVGRARHVASMGLPRMYFTEYGNPGAEVASRIPCLTGERAISATVFAAIELYECFTHSDPLTRAKELQRKVSGIVSGETHDKFLTFREFVRGERDDENIIRVAEQVRRELGYF